MPVISNRPNFNLRSVVYATDFSLCSQNAGLYAARLASYFSARLLVAHAFTVSQAAMEVEVDSRLVSRQRKDLQLQLAGKSFHLTSDTVEAIPTLLDGDPKEVVPKLANDHAPSLIVLGTHGGGWMGRAVIGSVAEQILRSTDWPSMTVGPQVLSVTPATLPFQRILFATDFTPAAAGAAKFAISLAEAFGSDLDLLNVIPEEVVSHPDRLSDLQSRFYTALDAFVPEQAKEFCNPRTFVEVGKAHHQILEHIRERSIDLLVLGIKRSHLGTEMRSSGAFQLIVDAACPVLTIKG